MKCVLIPTKLDNIAKDLLGKRGYQVIQNSESSLPELAKIHSNCEILIVRSEKVDSSIIDTLSKLKLVVRAGAGYNTIDTKYARKKGVAVMNTPGANSNAVAEEVIALILAQYRHIIAADISIRQGFWEKKNFMGCELTGKTVGIVGLGNIGQLLAKRLEGFEVKVLAYDPVISEEKAKVVGATLTDLNTLFSKCDIISLHIPATKETTGMINKEYFSLMKDGAMLVNCARAEVINENDLREIKQNKNLILCNDVYPKDSAGKKSIADIADIMLPHLGASTKEANYNAAKRSAEQIIAYFERGVSKYVVNKQVPDGLNAQYQNLAYQTAVIARNFLGVDLPVHSIACSFYGKLNRYAKWFYAPVIAGICKDFDANDDIQDAEEYLQAKGITFISRDVDDNKLYGNSITIDLMQGQNTISKVSVRGTIAEGNLMISRINNFDKLYFEPEGHSLIVAYKDRPGVLSSITKACAEADINIIDIRAPQEIGAKHAITIIKVDTPVPNCVIKQIKATVKPQVAFAVNI